MLKTNNLGNKYIPFHKLSEWFNYLTLELFKIIKLSDYFFN
ncbi:MAG: hypothetical protein MGU50_06075 [Trichodesmium sp. MAG_R02]|nr:hypothetical protein [Trichodesmium sp. MAG_R02]